MRPARRLLKFAFTEGVKQGSLRLTQPNHSSLMETESDRLSHNSVKTNGDFELQQIHQLRPETSVTMAPFKVNHTAPEQQAAKLPVYSTQYGAMDSNKTFQTVASFNTGKRYKRETNLNFSEGTVEQYESFRSQFNIHHKMLGWDTNRAGIDLYMSFEGKAALKVEEVVMNVNGASDVAEMWNALQHAFLPIDHHESKYRHLAMRRWRTGERMTKYIYEFICLFGKARPGGPAIFQNEEVKNQLLSGLPFEDKPLLSVQEQQSGSDDPIGYGEFE